MADESAFDNDVRLFVYRFWVDEGRPPVPPEIATAVGRPLDEVEAALTRLDAGHVVILIPGSTYIWMANPLSAIPTSFPVQAGGRELFGNCIWDALGVIAMLGGDGHVRTWCPDCGEQMGVEVRDEQVRGEGIVHIAVPAARFWEDIGFT